MIVNDKKILLTNVNYFFNENKFLNTSGLFLVKNGY